MLDGGPARIPKGSDRRSSYRRESTYPSSDNRKEVRDEPKSVPMTPPQTYQSQTSDGNKFPKWLIATILAVVVVIVVTIGIWVVMSNSKNSQTGIDESKYQAVFLSTGQIYFGKLEVMNEKNLQLTDVFYIQSNPGDESTTESPEDESTVASTESSGMELIKLGEEVHAPEDLLVINREHVLFYENIRPEGRVSQLIEDYKSGSN